LSLNTSTGVISGTPTAVAAQATYTVTASNSGGSTTVGVVITVNDVAPSSLTYSTNPATYTKGTAIANNTPSSSGGAVVSYAVSPALPAGLSLNTSTGVISGTPTAVAAQATYTVTASNSGGSTTVGVVITVSAALVTTQAVPTTTLTAGTAATPFTPVTASGGFGTLAYALSGGTLPSGLSFSTTTGQITGTPTTLLSATTFTVTVTDQTTPTAQISFKTFSLTVNPATLTTTQAVPTITLTQNVAATPVTPVTATGGFGTLSYALSGGTLPTGLSFSTTSGQITGTPTTLLATTTFTVTVTDQSTPVAQTSSKTFSLTVIVALPTVTAISPNTGPTTGGTSITLTGTNLAGATSVKFNTTNATSFTVVSATQIIAVAPAGPLGTVNVTVTTPSGTTPVSSADQFSYAVPADSVKLANLQKIVTPMVAQNSGQAIVGAIDGAISDGFGGGGGPLVSPSGNGMRFNFSADSDEQPRAIGATGARDPFSSAGPFNSASGRLSRGNDSPSSRTNDAFTALGYADAAKAPPLRAREPREWLGWAEVSGATLNRWTAPTAVNAVAAIPTIYGNQVNLTGGLTRILTPNFLVGVLGGWETFDYRSDAIQGRLKGDGWTAGAYTGLKLTSNLRFDAAFAYSGIGYDGTAGTAAGSFAGNRWLASGGLNGSFETYGLKVEPSARVYALWEREKAYVDSLGTMQAQRTFSTGRASGGAKIAYPFAWTESITLTPYAGLYGDYYFNTDDAQAVGAGAILPVFDGWSARAIVGIAAQFAGGGQLSVGGERSGIGGNFGLWTYRARASIPFGAR
jgi:Autotransporter beta-domain/IPT/TIG domain/Putative Ig domain